MSEIDHRVAAVLDKQVAPEQDVDALIEELERDDAGFDALREKRLEQLHLEVKRAKIMRQNDHGVYSEIKGEKNLMEITTSTKLCVVHFSKSDFNRCRIMDKHLEVDPSTSNSTTLLC